MKGWVDRNKFLEIQGRNRKPQISLADAWDIHDYPCPAGGCRLTDPNFAARLRDLFNHGEDNFSEIGLLKFGRHYRLPSGAKVIVRRNEQENRSIESLAPSSAFLLECAEEAEGPTTLIYKHQGDDDLRYAGGLTLRYSDYVGPDGKVNIFRKGQKDVSFREVSAIGDSTLTQFRI